MDLWTKYVFYSEENLRSYLRTHLAFEISEQLAEQIDRRKVSKSEIEEKACRLPGTVDLCLDDCRAFAVESIADLFAALDCYLEVRAVPVDEWREKKGLDVKFLNER